MKKGQRPSRHFKEVNTKSGKKPRIINPNILKTNRWGYFTNLDTNLSVTPRQEFANVPSISVYRLNEYGNGNTRDNAVVMLGIYSQADQSLLNVPKNADDVVNANERYYFIKAGSATVGVGALRLSTGEIQKIFILPNHRRKGYAKAFVLKMEEELSRRGASKAIMHVKQGNDVALSAWQSMGYEQNGNAPSGSVRLEKSLATSSTSEPIRVMRKI